MCEETNVQHVVSEFDRETGNIISEVLVIPKKWLPFVREIININPDDVGMYYSYELTLAQLARISGVVCQNITVNPASIFFLQAESRNNN
jgi:CRISPR/Cas system-associated protein Csx1